MDQVAIALIVLLVLVERDFQSAGGASVTVDVVREFAWVHFLDLSNSCGDLWLVASAATVFELD